jgi:hypothetical protein
VADVEWEKRVGRASRYLSRLPLLVVVPPQTERMGNIPVVVKDYLNKIPSILVEMMSEEISDCQLNQYAVTLQGWMLPVAFDSRSTRL